MSYIPYNPNPKGAKTGDCVIRAIAKALNMRWENVYAALSAQGFALGDWGSANHVWGAFLRENGFSRSAIPDTCPDCYTVRDFCRDNPDGTYILATGTHVVAVQEGDYYDTWDSGSEVPVYYWREIDGI